MEMSDTIAKLAVALCKAQKEIKGAVKDSKNPFFKSDYADLSSVWDAIRTPLTSNGLSVTQLTDVAPDGVIIETVLLHESGEYISGKLFMKPVKNDPQGIGSAITYGRRYGLQAISGVCPEDDDGNKASDNKGEDSPPEAITVDILLSKVGEARAIPHLQNIWVKYDKEIKGLSPEDLHRLVLAKDNKKVELGGAGK